MTENSHFASFEELPSAAEFVGFTPLAARITEAPHLIRVHVRDHRMVEVEPTLEVYFDRFVMSESERGDIHARRLAYEESYGRSRLDIEIHGFPAVSYELGPEPPADDPDPRSPAVVVWADRGRFVMLASEETRSSYLIDVAVGLYA